MAYDKIKINRLEEVLPPLENNTNKLLYCNGEELLYTDRNDLSNYLKIGNTVNGFKITAVSGTSFTYTGGSVLSQDGKMLVFDGKTVDTSLSINDGGTGTEIFQRTWNQPILATDTGTYASASCDSTYDANYPAWKAFCGFNVENTDCWMSAANSTYPHWLQFQTAYPIRVEKFIIQNRKITGEVGLVFDILASNDGINWDTLVSVNNKDIKPNTAASAFNEYTVKETYKEYKYFKYNCTESQAATSQVAIGQFLIVGQYYGYRYPQERFNIFVIGDDNNNTKIVTTIYEEPKLPEGYIHYARLGFFTTGFDNTTNFYYPQLSLNEDFQHGRIIAESLTTIGYRVFSDGWKIQWGNNANPTFPISFNDVPKIVERGATNVTTTGMTLAAQLWCVEGY